MSKWPQRLARDSHEGHGVLMPPVWYGCEGYPHHKTPVTALAGFSGASAEAG